jgi:hypothetical protein
MSIYSRQERNSHYHIVYPVFLFAIANYSKYHICRIAAIRVCFILHDVRNLA